jgi:alpha-tubulin suppressor-like RCC1 family protein
VVQGCDLGDTIDKLAVALQVLSWGTGASGVLGIGNEFDMYSPTLVKSLHGKGITAVACGLNHSSAW